LSLIKSTTYPSSAIAIIKEIKRKEAKEWIVDNFFLSIPILLQKEQLILNLKEDTKGLLLDGLGGLRA
jgi:hypothetical protein